jgi:hypothetical protein
VTEVENRRGHTWKVSRDWPADKTVLGGITPGFCSGRSHHRECSELPKTPVCSKHR